LAQIKLPLQSIIDEVFFVTSILNLLILHSTQLALVILLIFQKPFESNESRFVFAWYELCNK